MKLVPVKKRTPAVPMSTLADARLRAYQCKYRLVWKTHYTLEVGPDDGPDYKYSTSNAALVVADPFSIENLPKAPAANARKHDTLVYNRILELITEGYVVWQEVPIYICFYGSSTRVSGVIDLLAVRDDECRIEEIKTTEFEEHAPLQAMLYLAGVQKAICMKEERAVKSSIAGLFNAKLDAKVKKRIAGKAVVAYYKIGCNEPHSVFLDVKELGELRALVCSSFEPPKPSKAECKSCEPLHGVGDFSGTSCPIKSLVNIFPF